MDRHLRLIEPSTCTDARTMAIQYVFTEVCGSDPDPIEMQHCNELVKLGVSAEMAKTEFMMRKLRQLREMGDRKGEIT